MAEALALRSVPVDWIDLEIAYRDCASGVQSYLDLRSGEVIPIIDSNDEDAECVSREPERYAPIPLIQAQDEVEILREFCERVYEPGQRARLEKALASPAPLCQCFELIEKSATLAEAFCRYEEEAIYGRLAIWLASMGLTPRCAPPNRPDVHLVGWPTKGNRRSL